MRALLLVRIRWMCACVGTNKRSAMLPMMNGIQCTKWTVTTFGMSSSSALTAVVSEASSILYLYAVASIQSHSAMPYCTRRNHHKAQKTHSNINSCCLSVHVPSRSNKRSTLRGKKAAPRGLCPWCLCGCFCAACFLRPEHAVVRFFLLWTAEKLHRRGI